MEHTFTDWNVTVEPTCLPGERSHSCTRCQQTFTEEIEAVRDHTWGDWTVTTDPTPVICGIETHQCSECHTEETREIGKIANPFNDVDSKKWFALPAIYCNTKGFMNGTSEGVFSPNADLTRAQFATILAKVAGADTEAYKETKTAFTDVPTGKWYSAPIAWATENGYSSGISATLFGTNNVVTREQLAVFLNTYCRNNDIKGNDPADITGFSDYDKISNWAKVAFGWAVGNGLISGTSATTLAPKGNATRAQVATIIKSFVEKVIGDTEIEYELILDK